MRPEADGVDGYAGDDECASADNACYSHPNNGAILTVGTTKLTQL